MKSIKSKLLIFSGTVVIICSAILIYMTHDHVISNAEDLTKQQLSLALSFNLAIREYVADTLRPVMDTLVDEDRFIPETMSSSFVARSVFNKVRKYYPDYIIKFASVNPRNPKNQAGPEEFNMIRHFNGHPSEKDWTGEVDIDGEPYLAKFSAMRMEKACLRCHGNPADAPIELIKRYGPDASFYLPMGEVVGLDIVAIPTDSIKAFLLQKGVQDYGFVGIVILFLCASLVFVSKFVVTDRLGRITRHFCDLQAQSEDLAIQNLEEKGTDEIAVLTRSFNQLAERLNETYAKLRTEIEQRKQAQNALFESEEKYRKLFEMESDALVLTDIETGDVLDVNGAFVRLYGYGKEEIPCMKMADFSTEPGRTKTSIQNGDEYIPLRYHKKKNGTVFPVEITANIFEHKGKKVRIASIRDITDRKIIEQQIEESLREKEVLLSEIHHRVKNNFEIISSLLDMSSMRTKNRETQSLLFDSRSRIYSMALIHAQLYQSDFFDRIDMAKHSGELTEYLRSLFGKEKNIHIEIEPSEVYLPIHQAIPCALIINELVMNALKHAFTGRAQGTIRISIQNVDDNTVLMRIKDNGVGISETPDAKPAGGLGLELVNHLAEGQLKGEVRYNRDGGTDICIKFKRDK